MQNTREKTDYIKKTSYPVWVITTVSFIAGIAYVGVVNPFPYWWIFIILVSIQTISTIIYLVILSLFVDINSNDVSSNASTWIMVLSIIQALTLNLVNFAYGILFFNKLHSTYKKSF